MLALCQLRKLVEYVLVNSLLSKDGSAHLHLILLQAQCTHNNVRWNTIVLAKVIRCSLHEGVMVDVGAPVLKVLHRGGNRCYTFGCYGLSKRGFGLAQLALVVARWMTDCIAAQETL